MTATIYMIAIALYWGLEYLIRLAGFPNQPKMSFNYLPKPGREWTIGISPGYWIARWKKHRIDDLPKYKRLHARRRFVVSNNKLNLYLSILICFLALVPSHQTPEQIPIQIFWALATFRFISRVFEIGFAFGSDVISKPVNRSGLSKFSRVQLAMRSYVELFFLSAPVYYAHGIAEGRVEAITMSLSVGTLTNVGYAFPKGHTVEANLAFAQIFGTLSLVLLSLAFYVSRPNNSKHH